MKKIYMMMLIASMGLSGSVFAASTDALQQKVDNLEKELADLKVQMEDRNAELMDQLVERDNLSQAADTGLTAGYDKSFFIKSADDEFRMNIDARIQLRHTYSDASHGKTTDGKEGDVSRFELERTRLIFSGHAMKNLKYLVQFDLDDDGNHNAELYSGWVAYSFSPEFGLKAGCNDLQFGKQRATSSGKFMGVDRMMVVQNFQVDRSTGIEAFGQFGDMMNYSVGVFNGFGDGDAVKASNSDNNPAVVGRLMFPLLGATVKDFANESDLGYHESPVMMIGASFAYSNNLNENNAVDGKEGFNVLTSDSTGSIIDADDLVNAECEVTMLAADVSFKYKGFSTTVEGFYQNAEYADDVVSTYNTANPMATMGSSYQNMGWYAQAGQFLVPEKFELFARLGGISVDNGGDMYEYSSGWNYYINGQDLKLSMDVTYIDELANESSTANYNQGELGESLFMVRSQLQFQF